MVWYSGTPSTCRHGHEGWMHQRVQYDARRGRYYACWVCGECQRISTLFGSRRKRAKVAA